MNQNNPKPHPPKWATRFLEWYCDPYLLEDLQGDLLELYERKLKTHGQSKANGLYLWLVLRSFRWSALKKHQNYKTTFS